MRSCRPFGKTVQVRRCPATVTDRLCDHEPDTEMRATDHPARADGDRADTVRPRSLRAGLSWFWRQPVGRACRPSLI